MVIADKKMIIKTVQTMNQHLPGRRERLTNLLQAEKPGVRGKDNAFYIIDKSELEIICDALPRFLWSSLRLPILIEMSPQFGNGSARIQGDTEVELVKKLLNVDRGERNFVIIYMPEIRELRRKLPTTTQYAFVVSLR
jgi:uncharacterized protein (UPF0216 family)